MQCNGDVIRRFFLFVRTKTNRDSWVILIWQSVYIDACGLGKVWVWICGVFIARQAVFEWNSRLEFLCCERSAVLLIVAKTYVRSI